MNHLLLTREVLSVDEVTNIVLENSCGAISLFIGTTRDCFEGKKVISLEYEAYEPMALKQIELICEELRRHWPDIVNIAIFHRLGLVPVREPSVIIAISSPHRKTSLDAVAVAIEELKKRVPIWKKEMYEDKECSWKENSECQWLTKTQPNNSEVNCAKKSNAFCGTTCDIEDSNPLPIQLVQILASEEEIKRRIQCFVDKKRNEIDLCNIMDFTDFNRHSLQNNALSGQKQNDENQNESMTCARVNSNVVKQEYSKCHLKVRRVENNFGPQMRPDYLNALDKLMVPLIRGVACSQHSIAKIKDDSEEEAFMLKYPAVLDRLLNIEEHIRLPLFHSKDIYHRLKVIEDRMLYLESISPEYRHFLVEKYLNKTSTSTFKIKNHNTFGEGESTFETKMYSVSEINTLIQSFGGS